MFSSWHSIADDGYFEETSQYFAARYLLSCHVAVFAARIFSLIHLKPAQKNCTQLKFDSFDFAAVYRMRKFWLNEKKLRIMKKMYCTAKHIDCLIVINFVIVFFSVACSLCFWQSDRMKHDFMNVLRYNFKWFSRRRQLVNWGRENEIDATWCGE